MEKPLPSPLAFTGNPLDRASLSRANPAFMAGLLANGRMVPFWRQAPLLISGRAGFLPFAQCEELGDGPCVLLGVLDGVGHFALDISSEEEAPEGLGTFTEMRAAALILPPADAAMLAQGKALLDWHARHRFCAQCGAATDIADIGHRRVCPKCGAEHFPRTDPVVIMLPVLGDACLVGRNRRFPDGLYSAFAGFVEAGESLEDAVRRELSEEAGITVGAIQYHASQPWPFPSSLMLGCYADAQSRDFKVDGEEILEARWLTRDEVRKRLAGEMEDGLRLPAPIAIAHQLIKDWAAQARLPFVREAD